MIGWAGAELPQNPQNARFVLVRTLLFPDYRTDHRIPVPVLPLKPRLVLARRNHQIRTGLQAWLKGLPCAFFSVFSVCWN